MILADRFREIGLTAKEMRETPVRHATLRDDPAALAMRLFRDGGVITREALALLCGECEVPSGMLRITGDQVSSYYRLSVVERLYLFNDDEVLAAGETAAILYRAAHSARSVAKVLDLGCGSGVLGLLLAPRADLVVATDVNRRAVDLTRFNCEVNGIGNVETRCGSLYDPVDAERFDLIVCQPPFVPRPAGAAMSLFLHGGERGDELPRAVIAGLASRLKPGGRGIVFSDWGLCAGESLRDRIACQQMHATLFASPMVTVESYCSHYGRDLEAHMRELGLVGVTQCLAMFEEGSGMVEKEVLPQQWLQLIGFT